MQGPAPFVAVLALGALACAAPARPVSSGDAIVVAPSSASGQAATAPWATEMSLRLRQPQTLAHGLGVTLEGFVVEDVAADPNSGAAAYGMLVAKVALTDGPRKQVVEITSPNGQQAATPAIFGPYRVSYVSSSGEYSRDPVIVVRVERTTP